MDAGQIEQLALAVKVITLVGAPVTVLVAIIAYFYREDRQRIKELEQDKASNGYVKDVETRTTQAIDRFRDEVGGKIDLVLEVVRSRR